MLVGYMRVSTDSDRQVLDLQQLARELVRDGKSISSVARTFDVHPATIYRVIEG